MSTSRFFRLHTDHSRQPAALENMWAGPQPSACWLIGGGPSLAELPCQRVAAAPIPRMGINLAGTRLLRPHFWTSYDPTVRFHKSVYLDPGIMKFVHRRRAMDLVPETNFKVCECPNLYCFDRDGSPGFADMVSSSRTGILDWADSLVQAIDILYCLGFRTLYLAGCDMQVAPSPDLLELARLRGVTYTAGSALGDFLRQCRTAGVPSDELEAPGRLGQYHFDEHKPLAAAEATDAHYFRVVQYLRLSRRALALAGMRLVSVTPGSRLNQYFPYEPIETVLNQLAAEIGDPAQESAAGLYRQQQSRLPEGASAMRDFRPHNWTRHGGRPAVPSHTAAPPLPPGGQDDAPAEEVPLESPPDSRQQRARDILSRITEGRTPVRERG